MKFSGIVARWLDPFRWRSLKTKVVVVTLAIFAICVALAGTYISARMRADMQGILGEQQVATVSMAAASVNSDFNERIGALQSIAQSMSSTLLDKPASVQKLLEDRPLLQSFFNAGIFVMRSDRMAIAELPLIGRVGVNYMDRDHVAAALTQGEATVGKPVIGKSIRAPSFAMTVPIRDAEGKVIGALAGTTDLSNPNFLDSVNDARYGKGGGYLVVDPAHRLFVTAANRNFVMAPLPNPGINTVLDQRLKGFNAAAINVNSLGIEVLTSSARIPAAGWFLIATLPTQEAFAPIATMQRNLLQVTILFTVLACVLLWLILSGVLRRQFAPMMAATRSIEDLSAMAELPQALPIATHDEVGNLIGAFNRLFAALRNRQSELTAKVQQLRKFSLAIEQSSGSILITNLSAQIEYVNAAFVRTSGFAQDEVIGKNPRILQSGRTPRQTYVHMWQTLNQGQVWRGEFINKKKNGVEYPEDAVISPLRQNDGRITHYVAVKDDTSAARAADEQIRDLAYTDLLTQLPNRRQLIIRLQQELFAAARRSLQGALLFVDLDNFKSINDAVGHERGDLVLKEVARRLDTCVRESDFVARYGADEFVVMLTNLSPDSTEAISQVQAVGGNILGALGQIFQLHSSQIHCTSSIGIALFGKQAEEVDEPLWRAELAMYQAKAGGRNTLRFFDPKMQDVVNARVTLEASLREAIQNKQFVLHYQAQVSDSEGIVGVEALLRWLDPQRGMVSPAEFIPLAEETGLILPVGSWVLETACQQLALWAGKPKLEHLSIAVNVSARQFRERNFVSQTLATLERTRANPQRLKLELTESVLITDAEDVIVKMNALKVIGVGFAIDDFGTGYSSLSYLKRLPLERLKIDQSFIRNILMDADDAAIARAVIAMATSMGLGVIAEGVETQAQRDFLASIGCHNYQGYLFSRPLPVEEFEALVNAPA